MSSFKDIHELLDHAKTFIPKKIPNEMLKRKFDLNVETRIIKLKESKSIPPEYFIFLESLSESERGAVVSSITRIYNHIASVKKDHNIITRFKSGKISNNQNSDMAISSLSELYSAAKKFASIAPKYHEAVKFIREKSNSRVALNSKETKELDRKELFRSENEEKYYDLKKNILILFAETESTLASKGIK